MGTPLSGSSSHSRGKSRTFLVSKTRTLADVGSNSSGNPLFPQYLLEILLYKNNNQFFKNKYPKPEKVQNHNNLLAFSPHWLNKIVILKSAHSLGVFYLH